jgi:hypothetical protein
MCALIIVILLCFIFDRDRVLNIRVLFIAYDQCVIDVSVMVYDLMFIKDFVDYVYSRCINVCANMAEVGAPIAIPSFCLKK